MPIVISHATVASIFYAYQGVKSLGEAFPSNAKTSGNLWNFLKKCKGTTKI